MQATANNSKVTTMLATTPVNDNVPHNHHCAHFENITQLFKAIGHPLRLQILQMLKQNAYSVFELCELCDISQPALSHHLRILNEASLVQARREGIFLFYHRCHEQLSNSAVRKNIFIDIDKCTLSPHHRQAMNTIALRKRQASEIFFKENVQHFRKQQDLIADYDSYAKPVENMLTSGLYAKDTVLEVGAGDGKFLSVLLKYCHNIVALDISPQMLALAKSNIAKSQLKKVNFICGDSSASALKNIQTDCAILNMVLHHTPSPEQTLAEVTALLKKDGAMIICDLCNHDQNWVRSHCGDLWLGFEPNALDKMVENHGMYLNRSQYLGQRNGFQIQVREYLFSKSYNQ